VVHLFLCVSNHTTSYRARCSLSLSPFSRACIYPTVYCVVNLSRLGFGIKWVQTDEKDSDEMRYEYARREERGTCLQTCCWERSECDNKEVRPPGLLVDAHETMTALGGTEKEPKVYLHASSSRNNTFRVKRCGKTSLFNIFLDAKQYYLWKI
jgi:hypothetical protein